MALVDDLGPTLQRWSGSGVRGARHLARLLTRSSFPPPNPHLEASPRNLERARAWLRGTGQWLEDAFFAAPDDTLSLAAQIVEALPERG
jgi:hypothetical protein